MPRLLDRSAVLLGTAFYAGYFPVASGTFGSLIGVAVFLLISGWGWKGYFSVLILLVIAGTWSASRCEEIFKEKDSSRIVIDEIAGFLVSMAFVANSWGWIAAGFFLFRIFDIIKPPPANWIDLHMEKGLGVMADDIVAGLYALGVLHAVKLFVI